MDFDRNAAQPQQPPYQQPPYQQPPQQPYAQPQQPHQQPQQAYQQPQQPQPPYQQQFGQQPPYQQQYGQQPYPAAPQMATQPAAASTSYGRSFLATLIWIPVTVVLFSLAFGAPGSSRAAGQAVGSMIIPALLAALVTWLIFRRKRPAFWVLVLTSLPSFTVLWFLLGAVRVAGRT